MTQSNAELEVIKLYKEVAEFYGITPIELKERILKGEPLIHEWRVKVNNNEIPF